MDAASRAALRPSVRYVPGAWVLLAGDDVWLLAETPPSSPVVAACWTAIEQGAGVDHLLGIILREGLRVVPSFALAGRSESGMRVLVEGKARAEMRMPGADASLVTADGSPTWAERRVDGPIDVRLLSADADSDADADADADALPLGTGAVLAAEVTLAGVEAEAPLRPVTLVPVPEPTAPEPPAADAVTEDAPIVAAEGAVPILGRPASPETLQAPLEPDPARGEPSTQHVGLIESMPAWTPPAQHPPPVGPPWAPPAGPFAESTAIAGLDGIPAAGVRATVHRPPDLPPDLPPSGAPVPVAAPVVAATACPNQHLNPPFASQCRVCGAPVPHQEPFNVPRPVLGVLNLSTGDMVPLDRDVVLGRAPYVPDAEAPVRPHLVQLASPGNDISRSHIRITIEGWHVQVLDLGSINGTVVTLPGQAPVRLRAHDPFTIVPGTTISLADEVMARFDVASGARR